MSKRIAAALLFAVSIAALSGCAPWVNDAIHLAKDVKKNSEDYRQEKHQERVDELNQDYDEFLKSPGESGVDDEESEKSIVIKKDSFDSH